MGMVVTSSASKIGIIFEHIRYVQQERYHVADFELKRHTSTMSDMGVTYRCLKLETSNFRTQMARHEYMPLT